MCVTAKFALFCALLAPQIQGQLHGNLREPLQYLTSVVNELWVTIGEYGISNLPVPDTSLQYNYTGFGVELVGLVSFVDGFVQDIDLVSLDPTSFINSASRTQSSMSANVKFTNLRLYRDFRADLTTGMKVGTIVFTPAVFSYTLTITQVHGSDEVVPKLTFYSVSAPDWDIHPDDLETRLMRRQVQNQTLHAPTAPNFAESTSEAWIPIFDNFLNKITKTIAFPELYF